VGFNWEKKPKDNAILSSEFDKKFLKLYGRAAKINTGPSYEPDFDKNVRDFARFFNLKIVELQGSKKIQFINETSCFYARIFVNDLLTTSRSALKMPAPLISLPLTTGQTMDNIPSARS
jgi:hypothetical protein